MTLTGIFYVLCVLLFASNIFSIQNRKGTMGFVCQPWRNYSQLFFCPHSGFHHFGISGALMAATVVQLAKSVCILSPKKLLRRCCILKCLSAGKPFDSNKSRHALAVFNWTPLMVLCELCPLHFAGDWRNFLLDYDRFTEQKTTISGWTTARLCVFRTFKKDWSVHREKKSGCPYV